MKVAVANRDTLVLATRSLNVLATDYVMHQSSTKPVISFRYKRGEKYGVLPFNVRQGQKVLKQIEKLENMIHKLEA